MTTTRAQQDIDGLIRKAVFGSDDREKDKARREIMQSAFAAGIVPASIQGLYEAAGKKAYKGNTVPAINVRGITYDTSRCIFKAALKHDVGAFIFEIARSEAGYTDQRPAEYTAAVLAAAIREGFKGFVFIQADHTQVSASKFKADPDKELAGIKGYIKEAIAGGFLNIDIDASTIVDLSKPTLDQQQENNCAVTATMTEFIRSFQPEGVTISIGGEIGEVGGKNSDVHELRAYMDGFNRTLAKLAPGKPGLSKISVQTGTTHGGVVLPDGTIADVTIDIETLRVLSVEARERYGMAGAVQHGASTLPDKAFGKFAEIETAEIHLATAFQSLLFDHEATPPAFKAKLYDWLRVNAANERKAGQTDEQFFYTARKKAIGPFKREWWDLPEAARAALGAALERQFAFLLETLRVNGTSAMVARHVQPPVLRRAEPPAATAAAPDDAEAGE
jgi:fructose/tagatose bisphosphate aldolase